MQAVIGIGSNMGDSEAEIFQAIHWLGQCHRLICHSSLYRSAPLGGLDQDDFINAVAVIETEHAPQVLLMTMLDYEKKRGRKRIFTHAPRPIDLDLLLYDSAIIDEPDLVVPHPRMHERAFVLVPLLEIMPEAVIPGKGAASLYLDAPLSCQRIERINHEPLEHH